MDKMIKCPYCGCEIEYIDGAPCIFCPNCGNAIDLNNEDNPAKYDNPENF